MEHLGGWREIDERSFVPELWESLNIRSCLDVGCGTGTMVKWFRERDVEAYGIDGDPELLSRWEGRPYFFLHDYQKPRGERLCVEAVFSTEFVEHVDKEYVQNFLPDLTCGRILYMTHAVPGQAGHHHVNLQEKDYWIELMFQAGMRYDETETMRCREICRDETWFHKTGLVFKR